jgi:hypothetical protein
MSTDLLIFPGGSAEGVEVIETNRKGFSKWSISATSLEELKSLRPHGGWSGPDPTEIDHEGIGSFVEFGEPGGCLYCYSAQGSTN